MPLGFSSKGSGLCVGGGKASGGKMVEACQRLGSHGDWGFKLAGGQYETIEGILL